MTVEEFVQRIRDLRESGRPCIQTAGYRRHADLVISVLLVLLPFVLSSNLVQTGQPLQRCWW